MIVEGRHSRGVGFYYLVCLLAGRYPHFRWFFSLVWLDLLAKASASPCSFWRSATSEAPAPQRISRLPRSSVRSRLLLCYTSR
jgi:hypothetical protein